jgi:hypothetical protein
MIILLSLAGLLIAAASTAIFGASRLTTQGRLRHWTGDAISVTESQKRHAQIRWLRLIAGLCIVLLAIDAVAVYTFANYAANH